MTERNRSRNRAANQTPAKDAPDTPQVPDAQEPQDAAPAQDVPEVEAPEVTAPGTPAEDAPAQDDAPGAPAQPDTAGTPGDAPLADGQDAPADAAEARTEPTWRDFLAYAVNKDAAREAREAAFSLGAAGAWREALAAVAALPEDKPLTGDRFLFLVKGSNGRSVADAKARIAVIRSLFGAVSFVGSTHDSTNKNPMLFYVYAPDLFRPYLDAIMKVLEHDDGPIRVTEIVARGEQNGTKQFRTNTEYAHVNKVSRAAMEQSGNRMAQAIAAGFAGTRSDDGTVTSDPQISEIRQVLAVSAAALALWSPQRNIYRAEVERYAAPAPVTAGASA